MACHQIIVETRSILQQGFTIVMEDHTSLGKLVSSVSNSPFLPLETCWLSNPHNFLRVFASWKFQVPNSSFSSDRFHEIPQGLFHKKRFKPLMTKRLMERHDCVKNFIVTKHAVISSKINILYTRRIQHYRLRQDTGTRARASLFIQN